MKSVNINGKWPIILPDHRADRPEWHNPPYWEGARIQSLHDNLKPGDFIYYIGAEEGDMAGLIASWGVDIALFEPNDRVWPNIKAIWEANNLKTPIFTFLGFASNSNAEVSKGLDLGWPKSADGPLIGDHGFKELIDPGDIPQVSLDWFINDDLKPTAISMDVEGSEFLVLRGAEKTIRKYKPKLWISIHPEFQWRLYNQYSAEMRDWIIKLGYKEVLLDYPLHEAHFLYLPA